MTDLANFGSSSPHKAGACTIVIATLGLKERRDSLERAIQSIRRGNRAELRVLVVLNGNRFDPELVGELRRRSDIELVQIAPGSLSAAIYEGRKRVRTPFFGFLDDDDEYLPGAVDVRLKAMKEHPEASVVVTNGFRHLDGKDEMVMQHLSSVNEDPLRALFKENWLASCGGLYRAKDLGPEIFENVARYLEWTWLGFKIASTGKLIVAADEPTFRIHDTHESESKSEAYFFNGVTVLERMYETSQDPKIRSLLRAKLAQAWHNTSELHRRQGRKALAWKAHLKSLMYPTGFRYLPYTRHLIFARPG